jgi:hypothetical protein
MVEHLAPGRSRETKIRRDAAGRWYDDDVPITHPHLAAAFDAWLERAPDGRLCLKNEVNWAYVHVEGAPLFVRSAKVVGASVLLTLSDGQVEPLDLSTLRQDAAGRVYCQGRQGAMAARFDHHALLGLVDLVGEDDHGVYVELAGDKTRVPLAEDPVVWPSQNPPL